MTLYLNYDRAQALMRSSDLFIVRTISSLQGAMLAKANNPLRPAFPLDMCAFYNWVIFSVAEHLGNTVNYRPLPCDNACGVKYPILNEWEWKDSYFTRSGLGSKFLNIVKRNSVKDAAPFDVAFACAISSYAFDQKSLTAIFNSIGKTYIPLDVSGDIDEWAKGFFKDKDS